MVQLCPAPLVLYPKLCPVTQQGDACPCVITHDGRMVKGREALGVPVVGRGSKGKKDLERKRVKK